MFFSVIIKSLNWDILTKNLVTFKRWDGLRMKHFNIKEVPPKNLIFSGAHEKPI